MTRFKCNITFANHNKPFSNRHSLELNSIPFVDKKAIHSIELYKIGTSI